MNSLVNFFRAAVFAAAATLACAAAAVKPATPAASSPKTAARIAEPIDFGQLGQHIGREVVVHTKHGTRRVGVVVKAYNTLLVIKLGPADGGIDLDVARDTVRKVELITEVETSIGEDRAKKK